MVLAMKSPTVVVSALRRVLIMCICLLLLFSEPTSTLVQAKAEDRNHRVEAARESTRQTLQTAVHQTGEVGEKIQYHTGQAAEAAKDAATAAGVKVSEAAAAAKDTLLRAGQNTQEGAKKGYDSATGALGSAAEKASNSACSAKERVLSGYDTAAKNRDENYDVVYYGTTAAAGKYYYNTATEKTAQAAEVMKAAAARAGESVQSNAYQTAETSRNAVRDAGSTIYDSLAGAGEKISQAADAIKASMTPKGTDNARNSAAEILGIYDQDSVGEDGFFHHPSMMEKLGNIAEVMGWRRARAPADEEQQQQQQKKKWDLSKLSPYNIVIGNAIYEWHQKPGRDAVSRNVVGNSARNVGERLGSAGDYAARAATGASENVRGAAAHAKNKLWDSAAAAAAGIAGEKLLGSAGEIYANINDGKIDAASDSIKDATTTRSSSSENENLLDSRTDSGSTDGISIPEDTATDSDNNAGSQIGKKPESAGSKDEIPIQEDTTTHSDNNRPSQIGEKLESVGSNVGISIQKDTTDSDNNAASQKGEKLESAESKDGTFIQEDTTTDSINNAASQIVEKPESAGSKDGISIQEDTTNSNNHAACQIGEKPESAGSTDGIPIQEEDTTDSDNNNAASQIGEKPESAGTKDGTSIQEEDTTDSNNNAGSQIGEKLESAGIQAAETAGGLMESTKASGELTHFLYLITFATTYGSGIWMTFISGVILSKSIPRQQFGYVQSRIFPLYLKFVAMGDVILLVLYSTMHLLQSTAHSTAGIWQLVNLLLVIIATVFNVFVLEPQTTKLFVERLKLEKEEGRGLDYNRKTSPALESGERKLEAIKQQFKILHGYSTVLNLVNLAGLTLHAWHLAHHLTM